VVFRITINTNLRTSELNMWLWKLYLCLQHYKCSKQRKIFLLPTDGVPNLEYCWNNILLLWKDDFKICETQYCHLSSLQVGTTLFTKNCEIWILPKCLTYDEYINKEIIKLDISWCDFRAYCGMCQHFAYLSGMSQKTRDNIRYFS
jgi:hypothetical protein